MTLAFHAVLPHAVLWAIRGRWRRRRDWQALAQRGARRATGRSWSLVSRRLPDGRARAAAVGPRCGSPPPPGHDVVLMVDVSRSMGAEDAVPNRLAVAVEAAESWSRPWRWIRPTGRPWWPSPAAGVLLCPLTENLGAVLDALHRLRPGAVRPGGTDLGAGLDAALEAVELDEHAQGRAIVVFSDGEDHAERWSSRLERLRQHDIVVHAVTIGDSDQGHPGPRMKERPNPLVYRGEPVISRRYDASLETIARQTGGTFVKLGLASSDLGSLYQTRIEPLARQTPGGTSRLANRVERFPLLLFAAMMLLLAGSLPAASRLVLDLALDWNWRRPARAWFLPVF